ncbi:hypothetical protein OCO53_25320 [Peribacillus frigoritolerans]|uniref:hypothetical protein n=1 Tax=Peribacillus frigoritolerans TaxID=450367 RepID=UPI0021D09347|nr:hypothetical protein [Peribacillus frigoritolerans]MCU6603764.1 hypothetical protein [Peribacillus frigoritolerans]
MAEKQTEKGTKKIQVVGPKDNSSLAGVYRFSRDGRKKDIDIVKGQILTVGKDADITENEAQRLLNNQTWEVKEVSE